MSYKQLFPRYIVHKEFVPHLENMLRYEDFEYMYFWCIRQDSKDTAIIRFVTNDKSGRRILTDMPYDTKHYDTKHIGHVERNLDDGTWATISKEQANSAMMVIKAKLKLTQK